MSCGVSGFLLTLLLYLFVRLFASRTGEKRAHDPRSRVPIGRITEQHAEATDFAVRRRTGRTRRRLCPQSTWDGRRTCAGATGRHTRERVSIPSTAPGWCDASISTVTADDEVCVGDRCRIGEADFEVIQPRVTCYRVVMPLNEPGMASLLVAHHRPGVPHRRRHRRPGLPSDPDPATLRAALTIEALSPGGSSPSRR
ncbi:MOSC domain-containing protein [Streptomyces mirabilis]|uniref:MOSC domain-containing protein n=1 Tax=Streptomyces mirabilis TaxID=68239 RepID=UPI003714930A